MFTAGTGISSATPDGTGCHHGIFECSDGPNVTACGTWSFDVNTAGGITGQGEIASGLPGAPVSVALSGVVDSGTGSYGIALTSDAGGSGRIDLEYTGPTVDLSGTWFFTDKPEPVGDLVTGGVTGTSCVELP